MEQETTLNLIAQPQLMASPQRKFATVVYTLLHL